jgi:hypothetical protein
MVRRADVGVDAGADVEAVAMLELLRGGNSLSQAVSAE